MTDAAPPPSDEDTLEHTWARTAARMSVISAGAAMSALCTWGASDVVALPLGLIAFFLAMRAYQGSDEGTATRAYAKMALVIAGLSSTFSGAFLLLIAAWTGFWVFLAVLAN